MLYILLSLALVTSSANTNEENICGKDTHRGSDKTEEGVLHRCETPEGDFEIKIIYNDGETQEEELKL